MWVKCRGEAFRLWRELTVSCLVDRAGTYRRDESAQIGFLHLLFGKFAGDGEFLDLL